MTQHARTRRPGTRSVPADCDSCLCLVRESVVSNEPKPTPAAPDTIAARLRRAVAWDSLAYAAAGLVVAVALGLSPWAWTKNAGWLLRSIFHEAGHTFAALSMGYIAFPRISLDAHQPFTFIGEQQFLALCFIAWAGLAYVAYRCVQMRFLWRVFLAIAIAYPFIAFHPMRRQLFILLMGHGSELIFAGIFLWRANTGLFTAGRADRVAYAVVGWAVVFANFGLCWGILFDPRTRAEYMADGPLVNDYVVAAYELVGTPHISYVVVPMMLAAAAVYPLALMAQRRVAR